MATSTQKEKTTKRNLRQRVKTDKALTVADPCLAVNKKTDPYDSDNDSQSLYMSLDVLAQVASATLEKDPRFDNKKLPLVPKKLTKRSIQSLEILNLDQIQALSDKAVLSLFSEVSSNEMSRNYTFSCYLMPETCKESYTSFGNESRARAKMRVHLLSHIAQLIDEANDPDRTEPFYFSAVPVNIRMKKIADASKRPRNSINISTSLNSSAKKKLSKNCQPKFTSLRLRNKKALNDDEDLEAVIEAVQLQESDADNVKENSLIPSQTDALHGRNSALKGILSRSVSNKSYSEIESLKSNNKPNATSSKSVRHFPTSNKDIRDKQIQENEQLIKDLLSKTQPYHDHCYTTMFGKKNGIDKMSLQNSDDESNFDEGTGPIILNCKLEPILSLPSVRSTIDMPMVCSEEVVGDGICDAEGDKHDGFKPYPPMPKSNPAKKGRISVPEENISYSDEDIDQKVKEIQNNNDCYQINEGDDNSNVWETKLALKCIRELKTRKKDDRVPLVCKICKDKTFTASATLMYHYRSHAGIKPFICLICNTTFTRQHSLNYHMLIHNNQSRFTCKDCGRKFRHPSHFKEHLRRHTGETPFECTDCTLKFKTRNTYKRHLKTRHGKLLTAGGIYLLSQDEFLKVRTKPYKKVCSGTTGDSESASLSGSDDESDIVNGLQLDHINEIVNENSC